MTTQNSSITLNGIPRETEQPYQLPWICISPESPYFVTDKGNSWMPIGQNDAITWVELQGLFRRKNLAAVEDYLQMLASHGVTCLRLMLEYCQVEHRYFEKPLGNFAPNMVQLWDDLFALCEKYGLRILLTPYDPFWMWRRWSKHPYHHKNGGKITSRTKWFLEKPMRDAIKNRLAFVTERWGGSGVIFAWDLWNEIHPAYAQNSSEIFEDFISDISTFLRETELRLHGQAHLQTVSSFNPTLEDPRIAENIFRHPQLDFANNHFYEHGTINNPKNTVDAAVATGQLVRTALHEIQDLRPFFDSEHGPIHTFKDKKKTLPEAFDDEYFRHMQWAHLASGGAGGGMRWPNRHPHMLTPGMRAAQLAMAQFLPLLDWKNFKRANWNEEIKISNQNLHGFACGDENQAIIWLLRKNIMQKNKPLINDAEPFAIEIQLPDMNAGRFKITFWDTKSGGATHQYELLHPNKDIIYIHIPVIHHDLAIAISKM